MRIHLIGGILETACGKDLEAISYTDSKDMVTCLACKKTKMYKRLTYKQRIDWFVANFYETGMEYQIIYDSFKNKDLDKIEWYGDYIKIPKFKDEF